MTIKTMHDVETINLVVHVHNYCTTGSQYKVIHLILCLITSVLTQIYPQSGFRSEYD